MQSNPSYNINTGGGTSKYSNYSTGTYHDRSGGRYGSTGSRQQYGDVSGHQTTENFSYYQRYQDSAGMLLSMCTLHQLYVHRNAVVSSRKFTLSNFSRSYTNKSFHLPRIMGV